MTQSNFVTLKEYIPLGKPSTSNFELKTENIELNSTNNVMVKNEWISVDPYMRARMTEKKNYKEPFVINEPMEGAAIGKVIKSNSINFSENDIVTSNHGWRDNFVCNHKNIEKN